MLRVAAFCCVRTADQRGSIAADQARAQGLQLRFGPEDGGRASLEEVGREFNATRGAHPPDRVSAANCGNCATHRGQRS